MAGVEDISSICGQAHINSELTRPLPGHRQCGQETTGNKGNKVAPKEREEKRGWHTHAHLLFPTPLISKSYFTFSGMKCEKAWREVRYVTLVELSSHSQIHQKWERNDISSYCTYVQT